MMITRNCKHPIYPEFEAEILFHASVDEATGKLIHDVLDIFETVPKVLPKQLLEEIITHASQYYIREFVAEEISSYVNALAKK